MTIHNPVTRLISYNIARGIYTTVQSILEKPKDLNDLNHPWNEQYVRALNQLQSGIEEALNYLYNTGNHG